MSRPLRISYDEITDVVTIEGIQWTGQLFRNLSEWVGVPGCFIIERRSDGVVEITPTELPADAIGSA